MEKKIKIELKGAMETLLICLRAKAMDSRKANSLLHDVYADEILQSVDYDFSKIEATASFDDDQPNVWRAKHIDDWVREFIFNNKNAVVINLGCGLDTRVKRINPPETVDWYDVDFPDVMEIRKNFFAENAHYQMIASSVTETGWMEQIPDRRPALVVAEGVLEYLEPRDVETLFERTTNYFLHGEMLFDVASRGAVKLAAKSMQKQFGASHKWGVDDLRDIELFSPKLEKLAEIPLIKSPYVKKLPFGAFKIFCLTMQIFPFARRFMRLLKYKF